VFVNVVGIEKILSVSTTAGHAKSKSNYEERFEVVRIYKSLLFKIMKNKSVSAQQAAESITVISPYRLQCTEIRRALKREFNKETTRTKFKLSTDTKLNLSISTVVASQGNEWDFVILSTVRSLPVDEINTALSRPRFFSDHFGCVGNPHQVNVALTRAKHGLIIVGNEALLEKDRMWGALLADYRDNRCVVQKNKFLN